MFPPSVTFPPSGKVQPSPLKEQKNCHLVLEEIQLTLYLFSPGLIRVVGWLHVSSDARPPTPSRGRAGSWLAQVQLINQSCSPRNKWRRPLVKRFSVGHWLSATYNVQSQLPSYTCYTYCCNLQVPNKSFVWAIYMYMYGTFMINMINNLNSTTVATSANISTI